MNGLLPASQFLLGDEAIIYIEKHIAYDRPPEKRRLLKKL